MQDDKLTKRSLEVIFGLQEENGGITATTRDDAYPYVYPRDAAFMTMALNMHGFHDRSKRFYDFIRGVRRMKGEFYQRYNRGFPYVTQKGEFDVTPILLQGIHDTYRSSKDRAFLEGMWELILEGADFVLRSIDVSAGLVHTVRSVHETQSLEEGFEIWANSAAVKGLLDAARMAAELGHQEAAEDWRVHARMLWGRMVEKQYDLESGVFIKNIRRDGTRVSAPDMAQLSPFYFGLCSDNEILERTLKHLRQTLWNDAVGGFNRFRDFEVVGDWHWYTGGTGASWPLFTLWAAKFYHRLGDTGAAEECLNFVQRASTEEMCIPEKVAPLQGYAAWKENETEFNERILGGIAKAERAKISIPGYLPWACPLGWSHAEYLMLTRETESPEDLESLEEPILVVSGT